MKLLIFRSLWTNGFDLPGALQDCASGIFDGVEGPVPGESRAQKAFVSELLDSGVPFLAEITTAGSYVPERRAGVEEHLKSFHEKAEAALPAKPLFLTVLGGCDAWPLSASVDFFQGAMAIAESLKIGVSFETHRGRSMFHPWITRDLLDAIPTLALTCDFSHWCCVCERLVTSEAEIITRCAAHARHIHARVGYDQGAQVPHPAAPEYAGALAAHEEWWTQIWDEHWKRGESLVTMTPEFGPDGYLARLPYTQAPVADLGVINRWMAVRQRSRFAKWRSSR